MKLWIAFAFISILLLSACATQVNNPGIANPPSDLPRNETIYNNNEQQPAPDNVSENTTKMYFPMPLMDMTANDSYLGNEGGLYGHGMNIPPAAFRKAALDAEAKVVPLDSRGSPNPENGTIGFVAIGAKNAVLEFNVFASKAVSDPMVNPRVAFVNGAQEGKDLYVWATNGAPWAYLADKVDRAGMTNKQVEVAWIKLTDTKPVGEFPRTAYDDQDYLKTVIFKLKSEYPNIKMVYFSSRIYGGYDEMNWNPEPYAYETAFSIRWLILDQANGNLALNYDPLKGVVRAPIMVWGPYMWANDDNVRSDGLTWSRTDFTDDGSTPSKTGLDKTTKLLMDYFKYNELASGWFVAK